MKNGFLPPAWEASQPIVVSTFISAADCSVAVWTSAKPWPSPEL